MAHYLGDTIESIVLILDAAGTPASGILANVNAALYNPLDLLDDPALAIAEIAATGMYRCEFTRNNAGAWKVLWTCSSPICSKERVFDLTVDPNVALLAAIAGIPAAVDVVLSASHGAGSWEDAACDYHTQPF